MKKGILIVATLAVAAAIPALAATAPPATPAKPAPAHTRSLEDSYMVGAAFGAGSYEVFGYDPGVTGTQSAYKIGFRFNADLYRNDGWVTHLFTFEVAPMTNYAENVGYKSLTFDYGVPIYFARGRLRPAARPFVGTRLLLGEGGGSQGELGVLGGARFILKKCSFSDIYAGWRGRYGALGADLPTEVQGWKSAFVVRNANTIEIYGPACFYLTAAVDYDFTSRGRTGETVHGKPTFAFAAGPAFGW